MLLQCLLCLLVRRERRARRTGVGGMQALEDRVATYADFLDRFLADAQIRDQSKILLEEEPEVRCGLAMLLRKLTKVVVLGVGVQHL